MLTFGYAGRRQLIGLCKGEVCPLVCLTLEREVGDGRGHWLLPTSKDEQRETKRFGDVGAADRRGGPPR